MKTKTKTSGTYLFLLFLVAVPIVAWRGYILSVLWAWFVVPTFEAPALTVPAAIGLMFTITYLLPFGSREDEDKDEAERLAQTIVRGFGLPVFLLIAGWIVRGFM